LTVIKSFFGTFFDPCLAHELSNKMPIIKILIILFIP